MRWAVADVDFNDLEAAAWRRLGWELFTAWAYRGWWAAMPQGDTA